MVKIDSTKFGEITIDGKTYYSDVTIFWDGTIEYRGKEHVIDMDEFMKILEKKINVFIVGTGQEGILVISGKVRELAIEMKIKIFELKSPDAIDLFNGLASQGRRVAAVIHTTC